MPLTPLDLHPQPRPGRLNTPVGTGVKPTGGPVRPTGPGLRGMGRHASAQRLRLQPGRRAQPPWRARASAQPAGALARARAQATGRRADQRLWQGSLALLAAGGAALLLLAPPARWPLPGQWPTHADEATALWQLVALGALGLGLPALLAAQGGLTNQDRPLAATSLAHGGPARRAWLVGAAAALAWLGGLWVVSGSGP